ncbi:glycosyltransferase family 8 protein [Flexibacterium corallicola]|uniref:glycosyltransferase family 8 protein n=1 Tax=Flexibacterium corallicola TaxID=3037259 RepID=UPI00286EF4F3|nr:glycosyltransferase family 8 protein [Pseudovibrio sp. M1P-2-3]
MPINIVFAADQNYLKYTAVTLNSLLQNYEGNAALNIYILADREPALETLQAFECMQSVFPFKIEFIVANAGPYKDIKTTSGISEATYYRLNMHNLLPSCCKKVLYLDSDLLVLDCISKLYDTPMDDLLFKGAQDTISKRYAKKFGIPSKARNVNAGVLLIDLVKMREIDFDATCHKYIEKNAKKIFLGDQQILNSCFYKCIGYIPYEWNVHGSVFEDGWIEQNAGKLNSFTAKELTQATQTPSILHYSYRIKPWDGAAHAKAERWFEYVKGSGFEKALPQFEDVPLVELSKPRKKQSALKKFMRWARK